MGCFDGDINLFRCVANDPSVFLLSREYCDAHLLFNLAYGLNAFGLADMSSVESLESRLSVKMGSVVSPADCILLGDSAGWEYSKQNRIDSVLISFHPDPGLPHYTFYLTRRHYGKANIAFLNEHVESLNLRELTLPVETIHRCWR